MTLTDDILAHALTLGCDRAATLTLRPPRTGEQFTQWLAAGHHGEMGYLAEHAAVRLDPARLAPAARSMVVLLFNYNPPQSPAAGPDHGCVARYALSRDYHDLIKHQLFTLDAFLRARSGRTTLGKVAVDTAPLLERDFAAQAGLGFSGRNTCLITPGLGSWTFLAALLVPEELAPGQISRHATPQRDGTCGACTRCLVACPTRAFVGEHILDARRCISYLTIELRGPIPHELRPLLGNRVFGCDICQEVCPYNRCAPETTWTALAPDLRLAALPLRDLLALDDASFRQRFRGTPILRAKRRGLVRNACVAAGNAGDRSLVEPLRRLLLDGEPLVRGHAAWALGRTGGPEADMALRGALARETDAYVVTELRGALAALAGKVA